MKDISGLINHDWPARNIRSGEHPDKPSAGGDGKPAHLIAGEEQGGVVDIHLFRCGDDISGHNSGGGVPGWVGRNTAKDDITVGDDSENFAFVVADRNRTDIQLSHLSCDFIDGSFRSDAANSGGHEFFHIHQMTFFLANKKADCLSEIVCFLCRIVMYIFQIFLIDRFVRMPEGWSEKNQEGENFQPSDNHQEGEDEPNRIGEQGKVSADSGLTERKTGV